MRSLAFFVFASLAGACAASDASSPTEAPQPPASDPPRSAGEPRASADPASEPDPDPECPKAPCAARPIVFVHGFRGANDDWAPLAMELVNGDPRYDAVRFIGTSDHTDWTARSIGRRSWLFVFDYYVVHGNDARESYTAGHGRIGSNAGIVADNSVYDTGFVHDYAADLAALVDDVRRATGSAKVDIVAHSMGGLVTRSFLAFHGGNPKVERLLLVASPTAGVGIIDFAALFPSAFPDWMAAGEMTELDSGGPFMRAHFRLASEPGGAAGSWPAKLLAAEAASPVAAEVHVMSGDKDLLVSYESAHHPAAKTHVVADADHPGILKAPETVARVRELCGGVFGGGT